MTVDKYVLYPISFICIFLLFIFILKSCRPIPEQKIEDVHWKIEPYLTTKNDSIFLVYQLDGWKGRNYHYHHMLCAKIKNDAYYYYFGGRRSHRVYEPNVFQYNITRSRAYDYALKNRVFWLYKNKTLKKLEFK